jgi:hypothetical protein
MRTVVRNSVTPQPYGTARLSAPPTASDSGIIAGAIGRAAILAGMRIGSADRRFSFAAIDPPATMASVPSWVESRWAMKGRFSGLAFINSVLPARD